MLRAMTFHLPGFHVDAVRTNLRTGGLCQVPWSVNLKMEMHGSHFGVPSKQPKLVPTHEPIPSPTVGMHSAHVV